jgi:hypothetical protein
MSLFQKKAGRLADSRDFRSSQASKFVTFGPTNRIQKIAQKLWKTCQMMLKKVLPSLLTITTRVVSEYKLEPI